jgi:hypothetical protein
MLPSRGIQPRSNISSNSYRAGESRRLLQYKNITRATSRLPIHHDQENETRKQMRRFVSGYRTRYLPRATEIGASSLTTKRTVLALLSVSRGGHLRRRFGRSRRAVRIEVAKDPFHEFTESLWGRKNMGDGGLLRLTVRCSGQFHFKKFDSKHPFHEFTVAWNRFFMGAVLIALVFYRLVFLS